MSPRKVHHAFHLESGNPDYSTEDHCLIYEHNVVNHEVGVANYAR